jgi:hypothetical protein
LHSDLCEKRKYYLGLMMLSRKLCGLTNLTGIASQIVLWLIYLSKELPTECNNQHHVLVSQGFSDNMVIKTYPRKNVTALSSDTNVNKQQVKPRLPNAVVDKDNFLI